MEKRSPTNGKFTQGSASTPGQREARAHSTVPPQPPGAPITGKSSSPAGSTQAAPLILGSSPAIQRARQAVRKVAPTSCTVLLTGPTGSGKELFARLVHTLSGRRGPFIALNCAALSGALVEAELFGYARGAFTGASTSRPGLFQEAENGTLFLDELGELPLEAQASLLRALQEKAVRPVGASHEQRVNVRIVAATHRDLRKRVEEGTFREDLLYRLEESEVHIPPLSERRQDIPLIARYLLNEGRSAGSPRLSLEHEGARLLQTASWSGNVRELKSFVRQLQREAPGRVIRAGLVRRLLGSRLQARPSEDGQRLLVLLETLEEGSSTELRQRLGLSRNRVLKVLEGLVAQGLVQREGRARLTRYRRVVVPKLEVPEPSVQGSGSRDTPLAPAAGGHASTGERPMTDPSDGVGRLEGRVLEPGAGSVEGPSRSQLVALVLELLSANREEGVGLEALLRRAPGSSRGVLKGVLRQLKAAGRITLEGRTRGARWFLRVQEG